jgi:hypothetical protein
MHKHFRMLAISEHMRTHGYAPANEQHTRLPGIWKKMGTLYNLDGLDERVCVDYTTRCARRGWKSNPLTFYRICIYFRKIHFPSIRQRHRRRLMSHTARSNSLETTTAT